MSEITSMLASAIAWVLVLVCFAAAIVALAKLRVTPSGLLLGLGFLGLGLGRLVSKVYHALVVNPALEEARASYEVDADEVITSMLGVFSCVNVGTAVLALAIGLGAALLPYSLKRLAARDGGAPAS